MAIGDTVVVEGSIAAAAVLTVQPSAGIEWLIHVIMHEDEVSMHTKNGSRDYVFAGQTGADIYAPPGPLRVTNTQWLTVENKHASLAKIITVVGVITKQ